MNTSDNSTHSSVLEPEDNKLDGKPDDEAEKLADSEHAEGDQDPTEEEKKDEEKKKKKNPRRLHRILLFQTLRRFQKTSTNCLRPMKHRHSSLLPCPVSDTTPTSTLTSMFGLNLMCLTGVHVSISMSCLVSVCRCFIACDSTTQCRC